MGIYTWSRESRWWRNLCPNDLQAEESEAPVCGVCVSPVDLYIDLTLLLDDVSTVSGGPRDIRGYGTVGSSVPDLFRDLVPSDDVQHVAMRFEGVSFDKDTVFDSVTLYFETTQSVNSNTADLKIHGNTTLSGTAGELPTANDTLTFDNLTKTAAFTAHSINQLSATLEWTVDVTDVLNELLTQTNWSNGNDIILLLVMQTTGSDDFDAAITHNTTTTPKLEFKI